MIVKTKLLALIACIALIGPAEASSITYNVSIDAGDDDVTGSITTNGFIGALSDADIVSYNLTIQYVGPAVYSGQPAPLDNAPTNVACSSSCSSKVDITSVLSSPTPELIASATQITFDFSGNQYDYLTIGNTSSGNYLYLGDAQAYGRACHTGCGRRIHSGLPLRRVRHRQSYCHRRSHPATCRLTFVR